MPALLVLALAAGLARLLLQRRTVDFWARMDQPANPAPLQGPVLASEADREDTARALSAAIAEGRLSHDEGIERIGNAYIARHHSTSQGKHSQTLTCLSRGFRHGDEIAVDIPTAEIRPTRTPGAGVPAFSTARSAIVR